MKNLFHLPLHFLSIIVLVSCSSESHWEPPRDTVAKPGFVINFNFGFLSGDSILDTYMEMPVDSSATNLFVGRWKIIKHGFDETGRGNPKFTYYQDYDHKSCGLSFLQFNNDGVVFENVYTKRNKVCNLEGSIGTWELIEESRLRISDFDLIYIVNATQSELILKYDWKGTDWGPMQSIYYYERIQPTE